MFQTAVVGNVAENVHFAASLIQYVFRPVVYGEDVIDIRHQAFVVKFDRVLVHSLFSGLDAFVEVLG